ncbi:hypothetical protein BG261_03130 [Floricoccus tropicus]|uniref:DUF4767 domain-containing protein n=1 Tax=Floricoccus tropicus TaxID=1859473 RepID=A0A1E8GMW5_9LACT|nr:DUF4767 domain-containing protein [Floricoccus tropicus]OFI49589.1 hypothetical protein BG261_03130 [Floricoccus tropicus]
MKRKVLILSIIMLSCMMIFSGCKGKNESKGSSDEYILKDYVGINLKDSDINVYDNGKAEEVYKNSNGEAKVNFIITNIDSKKITKENRSDYMVISQEPKAGSKFYSSKSGSNYAQEVKLKVEKMLVENSDGKDKGKPKAIGTSSTSIESTNSETKNNPSEKTEEESKASVSNSNDLWDDQKDKKFADFMNYWSEIMNQPYSQGKLGKDIDFFGLFFPSDIGKVPFSVDNKPVSMVFSPNGIGDADYVVVASYGYISQAKLTGYLYLFCYQNGQPIVLLTRQNIEMPDGRIHFNISNDQDLINEFSAMNG